MKYLLTITCYCLCACAMAIDYTGNQLVAVLGKSVSSPEFLQYKNFWLLNSRYENPEGGIKVVINPNTLTVDTILVAGYDYAPSYSNCSSKLPYNILLNDNVSAISQKTGVAPTHYGGTVGYDVREYHIMVKYNSGSNINCMHFVNPNAKPYSSAPKLNVTIPEGASKMDIARINFEGAANQSNSSTHVAQPVTTAVQPAKKETAVATSSNGKLEAARRALEDGTFNTNTGTKISAPVTSSAAKPSTVSTGSTTTKPVTNTSTTSSSSTTPVAKPAATSATGTVTKTGTTTTTVVKSTPTFKTSILAVFNAWRESGFYSIKNTQRTGTNVWNYKYTYATKLRIPGEQYNMLYSFPFETSQMDFVSVLKESDSFDGFETAYKEYEKKLMESFPKSEGWIGTCLPNYDKSKISDFEIRNDRYGSVILDYCKTPKGKHILYLRFLLYS